MSEKGHLPSVHVQLVSSVDGKCGHNYFVG